MADIIQTPGPTNTGGGGGSAAGWAVAVIILLAVVAWFVFGGGLNRTTTYRADVKVTPPTLDTSHTSPRPQGSARTPDSAGGSVAIPSSPRP
ncbi:MAG TPA: hypothetical protein VGQ44_07625 [Gemmatimonadaceae bacterium]|nr:hypothetical protein [Gemmatimonadaceae bacterium]